ncbi:MAG: hypothetical protein F6J96_16170 [Symploca sp. SIO1C2]|nr:hypothetical protein [Symploca sp. SIO1C2]
MQSNLNIPKELRKKVDQELQPGEYIRWVEQPIPRFLTSSSIVSFLFAIPWTSFALFWIWGALGQELPNFKEGIQFQHIFALFGLPFVFIGLGMLSSPFWVWYAAKQTIYLITAQRAIIIKGGWSTTIRSYSPEQLKDVYRKEKADGSGDVIIAIRQWEDRKGNQRSEEIGFLGVRNSQEVEKLLKQLAQNAD